MHYYKRNLGDIAKKTSYLSPLEFGVYNLILDAYYDREQAPTLIEATRWARARTEEEKAAVLAVLDEFFELRDGQFYQNRVEEELCGYQKKAEKNREVGKRGGRPKNPDGFDVETQTVSNEEPKHNPNHKPLTNNHKPKEEQSAARGTRLPQDWRPSPEDQDYCKKERPDLRLSEVAQNFYDYWIAQPGAKGRKADWSATWRGWVRKESPGNRPQMPVADVTAGWK